MNGLNEGWMIHCGCIHERLEGIGAEVGVSTEGIGGHIISRHRSNYYCSTGINCFQ